jgi:hypothetical protein
MRLPAIKRATPPSSARWLVPVGAPRATAMFIEFQDLAGIAIFGVVTIGCLVYPPLLGFCMGVAVFCFFWWVTFKMIGG